MKMLRLGMLVLVCLVGIPTWVHAQALTVEIDAKPFLQNNLINVLGLGASRVAVLCSAALPDVTVVNQDSLQVLANTWTQPEGAAAQNCVVRDVTGDACVDLICGFDNADIDPTCETTSIVLTGTLTDGTAITGTDTVTPFPCFRRLPPALR